MKVHVLLTLSALTLLTSCGSDSEDLVDEDSPTPPPLRRSVPRLINPVTAPTPPPAPPQPVQAGPSIFRYPDVTQELPEEKALLSRPVSTPALSPVNPNTQ